MNNYIQYVYNLKGVAQFEKLNPTTRDAIIAVLLNQLEGPNSLEKKILEETDKDVLNFISQHLDLRLYCQSIILTTRKSSYIEDVDFSNVHAIINLKRTNFTQHLNKLFRAVNTLLPDAGIYIGSAETYSDRKTCFFTRFGSIMGQIVWLIDFCINRVFPRIRILENIYYSLTSGQFHCISSAEVLGRLVYCGFEIIEIKSINGLSYFVAMKVGEPLQSKNPSFYPIVKLPRIGKDGKLIGVYKFRTMHPYSEFIQDYLIRINGYNDKGKPANDYRVTRWGSYMRKIWLDELPQIINILKGEMKLVGLRPISWVRFNEFPEDLKRERIKYKPGCFPPYVALNMPDDKGNIEAERIYIRELANRPLLTDLKYFFLAIYNIMANKIRSS